jgi:hypothetical protein
MDKALEKLLELFSEFTWRRFFALVVVAFVVLLAFSLFERYTSSFRLGRLQRSAELIAKIQEIELAMTNASPELKNAYKALVSQATEAIETKPLSLDFVPSTLHFSLDILWKFLAGAAMWTLLGLIVMARTKPGVNRYNLFVGSTTSATACGIVGIWVPPMWWPWFHIFIFPVIFLMAIFVLFVPVGILINKRAAKRSA